MAIAKMHHFKLYSLKSLTNEMLSFLQNYGNVHINNLTEEGELLESGLEVEQFTFPDLLRSKIQDTYNNLEKII